METVDPNRLLTEGNESAAPADRMVTLAERDSSGTAAFMRTLGYEVLVSILWYSLGPIIVLVVLALFSGIWSHMPIAAVSLLLVIVAMSVFLTWTTLRGRSDKPKAYSERGVEPAAQGGPMTARLAQKRKHALIGIAGAMALLLGGAYAISHIGEKHRHDRELHAQEVPDQGVTDLLGSPVERLTCPEAEELARRVRIKLRYWHTCGGQDQTLQESNECNIMQWDLMRAKDALETKIKNECDN